MDYRLGRIVMLTKHTRKLVGLYIALLTVSSVSLYAQGFVRQGNKVICDNVRFDVLSGASIRMQFSPSRDFLNAPSAVVLNRNVGTTDFKTGEEKGWLVINTGKTTIRYHIGSGEFNSQNLSISWEADGQTHNWKPGDIDNENLGGTISSFNAIEKETKPEGKLPAFPPGFLSRSGYFLLNDSCSPVWDKKKDWVIPRKEKNNQDWYFFVYGRDYKSFFREYTALTGNIPMIPRYTLGGWVTDLNFEYTNQTYTENEVKEIVNRFRKENIPLDVLVLDFGWHLFGWKGGFDWSPIFPDPKGFMDWAHTNGVKVTLNDHPSCGLFYKDSHVKDIRKKLGISVPATNSENKTEPNVPFNLADNKVADVFMDLHNSMVDDGTDFWWIDGASAKMEGLDDQMWTNRVYYDLTQQHTNKRGFIFSRYGGPGSHRYPACFTGDCYSNWKVLEYEIPYTTKAGNVLIPYVTHDIGGFWGKLTDEYELYARWVQFGALSPMLRLHSSTENPEENARLPWNYGQKGIDLCRKFFQLRYSLIPYIYTYTRAAYETGLPIVRPLYLQYPQLEDAYKYEHEYLFGEELLVAPVVQPGDKDGIAVKTVYFPPGKWFDYFTADAYEGNQTIDYKCPLDRMPIFVKAGAIIPMQSDMAYTNEKTTDPLIINIYGGDNGSFNLYEDDGDSLDYSVGKFGLTPITFTEDKGNYQISIGRTEGKFKGQLEKRGYVVKLHNLSMPKTIKVNDSLLTQKQKDLKGEGWLSDERENIVIIELDRKSIRKSVKLTIAM
jgi:alpha-glucosidase (family GH31 glycosyl hydrolase)